MVVIEVSGGLGNQMFQYALYRKFKHLQREVILDTSFYRSGQKLRELELNVFSVDYKELIDEQAAKIRGYGYHDSIFDRLRYKLVPQKYSVYHDKIEEFQPDIFVMNNVYLSGYWQNEKYFADISEEIRYSFTFPQSAKKENEDLCKRISQENSVSVHIRRSDYLMADNARIYGNICTDQYYANAISYIDRKVENPHYYLFTDDLEWTKKKFKQSNMTIVENNRSKDSYMDMYLMSKCKHNIIANSSFSWWGAWLNANPDKIVLAPLKWFNNHKNDDVVCKEWVRIDNRAYNTRR